MEFPWPACSIQLTFFCSYLIWIWSCILQNFSINFCNNKLPWSSWPLSGLFSVNFEDSLSSICLLNLHVPQGSSNLIFSLHPLFLSDTPYIFTYHFHKMIPKYMTLFQTTQLKSRIIYQNAYWVFHRNWLPKKIIFATSHAQSYSFHKEWCHPLLPLKPNPET